MSKPPELFTPQRKRGYRITPISESERKATKARMTIHGDCSNGKISAENKIWQGIVKRCENRHEKSWPLYGGRGIKICSSWRNSYAQFLKDMGRRPSENHSIDRINNDGNYEPNNCRWATQKEQNNNTRVNHKVNFRGIILNITQVARLLGMSRWVLLWRLKTWGEGEKTFSTKVRSH